jgi:alkylation response protein AidB-like acyl-CoA dehydrogenase
LYPVSKPVSKSRLAGGRLFFESGIDFDTVGAVDVRFSAEQVALRDSVVQVVGRLGPKAVAQLDDVERAATLDAAVDAAGWRELRTADHDGGPWASGVEAAIVAEELARGLADTAFVGPTLAAELRRLCEPPVPSPSARETVTTTGDLGALGAGVAIDAAGATSGLGLEGDTVVELSLGASLPPVDLTRPSRAVGATKPGRVGVLSSDDLARWTALGLALACADLVGAMRGAVELSRVYAQERRQYGVAVGSFQAVQHMLADAYVWTEGSRSVALHAAWAVDALPPAEALAAAATAKAYCARAGRAVCETAIQVHGGIGNTWDCLAHVFLRRALLSVDLLGGEGPSLARVLEHRGVQGGLR